MWASCATCRSGAVARPAASGLSPWLHWGHLSTHEIFDRLARRGHPLAVGMIIPNNAPDNPAYDSD